MTNARGDNCTGWNIVPGVGAGTPGQTKAHSDPGFKSWQTHVQPSEVKTVLHNAETPEVEAGIVVNAVSWHCTSHPVPGIISQQTAVQSSLVVVNPLFWTRGLRGGLDVGRGIAVENPSH